jgi:hypothetical protein
MNHYKELALLNYPLRDFDLATRCRVTGMQSARRVKVKHAWNSKTEGMCANFIIPEDHTEESCEAQKGCFEPVCIRSEMPLSCEEYASYDYCSANNYDSKKNRASVLYRPRRIQKERKSAILRCEQRLYSQYLEGFIGNRKCRAHPDMDGHRPELTGEDHPLAGRQINCDYSTQQFISDQ